MFRVSLRYGIPLLIVVFTAILAAYTVQKEWDAAGAVVWGEAVSEMINLYLVAAGRYVLGIYPTSFGTVGEVDRSA
jgi:hypothetical protein